MKKKIILIGAGIAAITGYAIYRGLSIAETAGNIRVSLASLPKIHSISLTNGIKVSVDLRVDNPGKERLSIKIPSARFLYKDKLLASTTISNRTWTVEPEATNKISGIMVEAGILNLIGTGIMTDSDRTNNIGFDAMLEINGLPVQINKLSQSPQTLSTQKKLT